MTWPTGAVNTANTDASTDSPANARADFLDLEQKVNQIIANGEPVRQAGNQTIDGTKTFSSSPSVPVGATNGQAVNKGQMDSAISSSNPASSSTTPGHVELATNAETQAGTDSSRAVTPAGLANAMLAGNTQAWTFVTGSRLTDIIYTNTTGRPIVVSVFLQISVGYTDISLVVDGHNADRSSSTAWPANSYTSLSAIVPDGKQYKVAVLSGSANVSSWEELR